MKEKKYQRISKICRIKNIHRYTIWRWVKAKLIDHKTEKYRGRAVFLVSNDDVNAVLLKEKKV